MTPDTARRFRLDDEGDSSGASVVALGRIMTRHIGRNVRVLVAIGVRGVGGRRVAPPSTPAAAMPNSWSASLRDTRGVLAGASALAVDATTASFRIGAIPEACRCSY